MERNPGRRKSKPQRCIEVMHGDIVGRNAGGNLLRTFVPMESDHRPPDAPSKSPSFEAGSQADEGPEPARWAWSLDDHKGDRTGVHATFQHALSRMMEGVRSPSAVAPIADLRAHLRINMEPPTGKDLAGKSRESPPNPPDRPDGRRLLDRS